MRCERDSCCANGIFIEPLKFFGLLRLKYYVVYEVRKDADADADVDANADRDTDTDWELGLGFGFLYALPLHFD